MQIRITIDSWVVVVTGASSGNGNAIALTLASKAARLILAARGVRLLLQAVAREIEDLGAHLPSGTRGLRRTLR